MRWEMSSITIPPPEEDLSFLRAYSSAQGTSAEEFLARQARNLRRQLAKPLNRQVETASGTIDTDIDARSARLEYLDNRNP